MKSILIAGLTAGFSSLFATAALAACPGAGCAYAPASPHYAFGPLPAYGAAPAYAPPAYGPPAYAAPHYPAPQYSAPAPGGYGPPPSYGSPPPYAPQGYGRPDYGPAQLPPPPYRRDEGERGGYGRPDYAPQDYGRGGYEPGEYDALGDNAPVLGEQAYAQGGYRQDGYGAYQEQSYRQSFHQSAGGYPPGYPCMSCSAPPPAYYPQPCHRPAYVCVAPPVKKSP